MIYEFIRVEKAFFPISVLCRVLRVSRSGFYSWHRGDRAKRELSDRRLLVEIRAVFEASRRTYGSPRVHDELRKQGIRCSLARVERLMRENGITPPKKSKFKKTTDSDHPHTVAPNLLDRDFTSPSPDRRWSTDITYVWTVEGWLYLAVVMDLFSRRIVGWSMGSRLTRTLALSALRMALWQRHPDAELLHHSDRGCQYASNDYQGELRRRKITCSMSRRGNCWDNAVVESFFSTLKRELIHRHRFETRQEAAEAIFDYVEVFYNRQRSHSHLGYLSPAEFEQRHWMAA